MILKSLNYNVFFVFVDKLKNVEYVQKENGGNVEIILNLEKTRFWAKDNDCRLNVEKIYNILIKELFFNRL